MRRYWWATAALVALAVSLSAQTPAARRTIAIKAGRLLDVAAREVRTGTVIIVEGGRIREIDSAVPAGAEVIDLSQYTVLPGFIDAHTHVLLQGDATADDYDAQLLKESLPYRALRATRRDADRARPRLHDAARHRQRGRRLRRRRPEARGRARASSQGPRLFVATKALAPTGAYGLSGYAWELDVPKGVEMCDGPDGCRHAVRDQIAHGADWIKVYADRCYYKHAGRDDPQPPELHGRGDARHRRPGAPHAAEGRGALDDADRPRDRARRRRRLDRARRRARRRDDHDHGRARRVLVPDADGRRLRRRAAQS